MGWDAIYVLDLKQSCWCLTIPWGRKRPKPKEYAGRVLLGRDIVHDYGGAITIGKSQSLAPVLPAAHPLTLQQQADPRSAAVPTLR